MVLCQRRREREKGITSSPHRAQCLTGETGTAMATEWGKSDEGGITRGCGHMRRGEEAPLKNC